MPTDIAGLVWLVGGGTILVLLSVIGHFWVGWMRRHDTKIDQHDEDIAELGRDFAVIKAENKTVLDKVEDVIDKIQSHIDSEESFWRENRSLHKQTQDRLLKIETKHELEG